MHISKPVVFGGLVFLWAGGMFGGWLTRGDNEELRVVFCNVGQGDAIIVIDKDFQALIDGGPEASVLACLAQEMPAGDQELELVILTHSDSDHLAGLNHVLSHYRVGRLIVDNLIKGTADFKKFYQLVWQQQKKWGARVESVTRAQKWCETARVCMEVWSVAPNFLPGNIWQKKESEEKLSDMLTKYVAKSYDYNNGSIVINLTVDDKKFTLSGDVERAGELAMIEQGLLTKIDVLKIAHHGSKTSSSREILSILQPEYCVIMCGLKNSYGHPHKETLVSLEWVGCQVLRTDWHGTVRFVQRESGRWEVETEKGR